MNAKLKFPGKFRWAALFFISLLLVLPGEAEAAAARGGARIAPTTHGSAVPGSWARPGAAAVRFVNPYPYYPYYYPYGYPYPFSGYYAQPIVVISPGYDPYSVAPSIVASSPFYCLAHRAGWVSRAGMLDHLSGTHKIPLGTAASVCPDASDGCVVDGY